MRKLILSMLVSADGFMAGPDGDLEWFLTDDELEQEMLGVLRSVDLILLGRVSYELLAAYWPTAGTPAAGEAPGGFTSSEREIEFARLMNTIPKVVFSRTLERADWGPVTIEREVDAEEIARLKQQPGKDLVLFAGAKIAAGFAELDLFDEYHLLVHPVVLGGGIPMFDGGTARRELKLRRTRTFRSGVVVLQYLRNP